MNKTFEFLLLALGMFLGSLLCGFAPACIAAKPQSVGVISLYGAGLLIGVSLLIIIPEGIRSMYLTSFNQMKQLSLSSGAKTLENISYESIENPEHGTFETHQTVGICLIAGFILMVMVEQLFHIWKENSMQQKDQTAAAGSEELVSQPFPECDYFNKPKSTDQIQDRKDLPDGVNIAVLGILIHCIADGFAFGSSGYIQGFSFSFLIFIALMLHKAPEAFSVAAFLLHENCARSLVYRLMLIVASVTPISGLLTYAAISYAMGSSSESRQDYSIVAVCLLISAGSFLYVATMHVLPEVYCNNEVHRPHSHTHFAEEQIHEKVHLSKLTEMVIVIAGALTPFALALMLPDDD